MSATQAESATVLRCRVCESSDCAIVGPPAHHLPTRVAGVPIDIANLPLRYVRCASCGYCFIDPPIPEQLLLDCYRRSTGEHWSTDDSVAVLRAYATKRDAIIRLAPGNRVLDFGCYDGGFLAYLGEGFVRCGIEPSTAAVQRAQARGIQILATSLDEIQPQNVPPFDAIVIFDVMEHVLAPVSVLTKLTALLKPGGIIVIETGNTDAPAFERLGPRYTYAAIVEHVGFFNQSSIREAGRRAGLKVLEFHKTRHTNYPGFSPIKNRFVNMVYGILRVLRKLRVPMGERYRNIAAGPVPRTLDLDDHFLAVLQRPGDSS